VDQTVIHGDKVRQLKYMQAFQVNRSFCLQWKKTFKKYNQDQQPVRML
jgi:hypothetical protein